MDWESLQSNWVGSEASDAIPLVTAGNLVTGGGHWRFQPGELAKLDKVDVNRSRIDLHLSLSEPMLVPWQEGPFTLYRESACKVELEIAVPRESALIRRRLRSRRRRGDGRGHEAHRSACRGG